MQTCKNPECQKEIPEGLTYCNENCLRRDIELRQQTQTNNDLPKALPETQLVGRQRHQDPTLDVKWILGSGASARKRNIETIISLLDQGVSPEEILDSEIILCFKDSTIIEYLRVASRILAKRKQRKRSGTK